MMSDSHLARYLEAWSVHCQDGGVSAASMISESSDSIVYADINAPQSFNGAEGIEQMCQGAAVLLPGAVMEVEETLVSGDSWATRWELRGTHPKNESTFKIQGASFGRLDAEGKVSSHTDYWNPLHFQAQTGLPLMPS